MIITPAISGDPRLRQTVSCSRGAWHEDAATPYAITYRWLRNGTAIPGATAATYTITTADLDTNLYCEARAESLTASQSPAVSVTAPRIVLSQVLSGQPRLRKTMSCGRGTWDDIATDRYAVTHQWFRDSVAIPDATQTTYAVLATDTAKSLSCQTRAETRTPTNPVNGAETVRAPLNRIVPRLSGMPRVRQQLSCGRGDWDDEETDRYSVTYRWFRGSTAIANQTTPTYTLTAADIQQSIHCRVRAEDQTEAQSASISIRRPDNVIAPQITGDPRLFRTLSCTRGDWDDTAADRYAVTYTWFRNSVAIPGATTANYTVGPDDMNKGLYCRVRAEDNIDANSGTVYPDLPRAIVPPQISGQPHLRGELTCTRGTWDDTPERRYAVSYQWYRSGIPISGATDPAYVLGTADLNRYITCRVAAEVLRDSAADSLYVYGPYDTVEPSIEGIAHPRRELSCTRGEWNDSPANPYVLTYQWYRNDTLIPGADGPDHIVVAEDVGGYLRCAVTAEGQHTAWSYYVYPSWEPLRVALTADNDATAPFASNGVHAARPQRQPRGRDHHGARVDHARRVLLPLGDHDRRTDDGPGPHRPELADAALDERLPGPRSPGSRSSASGSRPAPRIGDFFASAMADPGERRLQQPAARTAPRASPSRAPSPRAARARSTARRATTCWSAPRATT